MVGATTFPGVIVVASHLPGEMPFTSGRWDVHPVECVGDFDYSRGLAEAWATGNTVVNVEHDMQVDDDLIGALVECPEPLCAWAYRLYAASGAHGTADGPIFPFTATEPGPWVDEGAQWAAWAAPGFIKVRAPARIGPFPGKHWLTVEHATNYFTAGLWHLHWPPIEHYHQ